MQLFLALFAPVLSQVTDLADVSARVASLEQQLRSANVAIAASWSTLAAEACVLTDEYSSERMSKLESLDAVGRLASNVQGQASAQQAHLLPRWPKERSLITRPHPCRRPNLPASLLTWIMPTP
jgi:hypothetical protein